MTCPQLTAHGFVPRVFLSDCNPAGGANQARDALAALEYARAEGGHALFVEDDIDVSRDFRWHVGASVMLDRLVYLYLNDSPSRMARHHGKVLTSEMLERRPMLRGPRRVLKPVALFGTQAVVMPERWVDRSLEALREPGKLAFDSRLQALVRRHYRDDPVFVSLPHPVQHRRAREGREPTQVVMRSLSYGIPVSGTLEGFEEVKV